MYSMVRVIYTKKDREENARLRLFFCSLTDDLHIWHDFAHKDRTWFTNASIDWTPVFLAFSWNYKNVLSEFDINLKSTPLLVVRHRNVPVKATRNYEYIYLYVLYSWILLYNTLLVLPKLFKMYKILHSYENILDIHVFSDKRFLTLRVTPE